MTSPDALAILLRRVARETGLPEYSRYSGPDAEYCAAEFLGEYLAPRLDEAHAIALAEAPIAQGDDLTAEDAEQYARENEDRIAAELILGIYKPLVIPIDPVEISMAEPALTTAGHSPPATPRAAGSASQPTERAAMSAQNCTTHHDACDCREAAVNEALRIALHHMQADRDMLLESHCLLDKNLRPRRDTLDEMAKPLVAQIERDIAKVRAAIRGAS